MSVDIAMCVLQYCHLLPGLIGAFGYANRTASAPQLFAHDKHPCFTCFTLCAFLCGRCPSLCAVPLSTWALSWTNLAPKSPCNFASTCCLKENPFMTSSGRFITRHPRRFRKRVCFALNMHVVAKHFLNITFQLLSSARTCSTQCNEFVFESSNTFYTLHSICYLQQEPSINARTLSLSLVIAWHEATCHCIQYNIPQRLPTSGIRNISHNGGCITCVLTPVKTILK